MSIINMEEYSPLYINQKARELALKDVDILNAMQLKDYDNKIFNWKANYKKDPIPEPLGSYKVDEIQDPRYPAYTIPEIRYHPEIPICEKYVEPVDTKIYTAVVGDEIVGYTPPRYISLDTLPIGTQGYTKDGKLVTKVGVLTPFGKMVWYQ